MRRKNRRQFLAESASIGVGAWIAGPRLLRAENSPNEKLNVACIGVGGKGSGDTDHAGMFGNVVGLCDVDDLRLAAKALKFPAAKTFSDFRQMLEQLEKSIDAVVVSTPDHTHAAASMM